jgi:hypothetical protein
MTWNTALDEAPRDRHVLMATTDGKRYLTRWLIPTKFTPNGRWDGFSESPKTLLAWCAVPEHPNHKSDAGEFAAVKGKARLANATSVEPSASGLITHHHILLDDAGSGA